MKPNDGAPQAQIDLTSTMASSDLSIALLRPAILHILRAAGFHGARVSAVDTIVDIAYRYMILLAEKTAEYALINDTKPPDVTEVRMALEEVGAFVPQISAAEEQLLYDDDLRGLQNFMTWVEGDIHKEIRRIAGLEASLGEVNLTGDMEREDFLTSEHSTIVKVGKLIDISIEEETQQNRRRVEISRNGFGKTGDRQVGQDRRY